MTGSEFKEKYKIQFLLPKSVLKLESNNINMKDIIDPDAKTDFPFFTKEYLKSVIKTDSTYLNNWIPKRFIPNTIIFILLQIIFLPAIIVFITYGELYKNFVFLLIWGGFFSVEAGSLALYALIFASYYPLFTSLKNKKFLIMIKDFFLQKPENFPLTVRLLYFPEDIKYLPKHSKLRSPKWLADLPKINPKTNQDYWNKNKLELDYGNGRKSEKNALYLYKISKVTIRTAIEFNNFVIKFCQYLLDIDYNNDKNKQV